MERGQTATTTPLVELLRNKMDGAADRLSRRKKLTQRFRLKGISCCGGGSSFGLMMGIVSNPLSDDEEEDEEELEEGPRDPANVPHAYPPSPTAAVPAASGMNLAPALVAERMFRAVQDQGGENINVDSSNTTSPSRPPNHSEREVNGGNGSTTPALRVSLMRLLTETDGKDGGEIHKGSSSSSSDDYLCCVCMGKKKDAAFIPCGHTLCRGCARDLWFNRGFCPLCNRCIMDVLHIF